MFSIGQHFLKNYIGELWGSGAGDSFNVGINLRQLSHQKHRVLCLGIQYPSVSGDPLPYLEDEPENFFAVPSSLNVLPIIFYLSPIILKINFIGIKFTHINIHFKCTV